MEDKAPNSEKFKPKPYQRKANLKTPSKSLKVNSALIETNPYKTNPILTQDYSDIIINNKLEKELEAVKTKLVEKANKIKSASNIRKSSNSNKDLAVKIGSRVGRGITAEEIEKSLSDHLKHVKGRSSKK